MFVEVMTKEALNDSGLGGRETNSRRRYDSTDEMDIIISGNQIKER